MSEIWLVNAAYFVTDKNPNYYFNMSFIIWVKLTQYKASLIQSFFIVKL